MFYPKAEFQKAGYQIPQTWDELLALSDQIVADGGTPWCFGFESGVATGWPGTDFIESLVLRVGGVETYDAWTRGEIGFTSPAVMEAGRLADAGLQARIREGRCGEHQRRALQGPAQTHAPSRQCDRRDRTGVLAVPPGRLPADNSSPQPTRSARMSTSSCSLRSTRVSRLRPSVRRTSCPPSTDRPEVREFMEFVASPEWGSSTGPPSRGRAFISPNQRFDLSNYGDASHDPGAAA